MSWLMLYSFEELGYSYQVSWFLSLLNLETEKTL